MPPDLARFIDHTLLAPDATGADVDRLCDEARELGFAAVCVNPFWVKRAARNLEGIGVAVASVVAFPLGATTPDLKAAEARSAISEGAREIDMVMNVGAFRSGERDVVRDEIEEVAGACHEADAILKVIIETALLTGDEKVDAARLAQQAHGDFVKTSTGFGPGGATVEDVRLIRQTVGPEMGIKASGGIRSAEEAEAMIAAGATRIGTSSGVRIVGERSAGAQGRASRHA